MSTHGSGVLGQAKSTGEGYDAAMLVFNEFRDSNEDSRFDDMIEKDVEGDFMYRLLLDFASYLANTNIRDKRTSNEEAMITKVTKEKYLGKMKENLKKRYPRHELWRTEPTWYPELLKNYKQEIDRHESKSSMDHGRDTASLYMVSLEGQFRALDLKNITPEVAKGYNILAVLFSILQKAQGVHVGPTDIGPYQKSLFLDLTSKCIARGGEGKFVRWDKTDYDYLELAIDTTWPEQKTLKNKPMLIFSLAPIDRNRFAIDTLHRFGAFFAVENGLSRDLTTDEGKASRKYIFPMFHSYKDEYIASLVTKWLQREVPPSMKKRTTSKSIRRGGNNALAANPDILFQERLERGGWSSGTNAESYNDHNPMMNAPGGKALNLWPRPHEKVSPPRLDKIGNDNADRLAKFINELVANNDVPSLQPRGGLRSFFNSCIAALIMYHPNVITQFGYADPLADKMLKAARRAGIQDKELESWGDLIWNDYRDNNKHQFAAQAKNNDDDLCAIVNNHGKTIHELAKKHNDEILSISNLTARVEAMENKIDTLITLVSQLIPQANTATPSAKRRHTGLPAPQSATQAMPQPAVMAQATPRPAVNAQATASSSSASASTQRNRGTIQYGADAAKMTSSNANLSVSLIFKQLQQSGQLNKEEVNFKLTSLTGLTEPKQYERVMILVQHVWDTDTSIEDKKAFKPPNDADRMNKKAGEIQKKVMAHMLSLENSLLPADEQKTITKHRPYYIGLGSRYKLYVDEKEKIEQQARARGYFGLN